MFLELSLGITSNGMAPPVITWVDVQAFDIAGDHGLQPWEKRMLVKLGNLRASIMAEEKPKKPAEAPSKPRRK